MGMVSVEGFDLTIGPCLPTARYVGQKSAGLEIDSELHGQLH